MVRIIPSKQDEMEELKIYHGKNGTLPDSKSNSFIFVKAATNFLLDEQSELFQKSKNHFDKTTITKSGANIFLKYFCNMKKKDKDHEVSVDYQYLTYLFQSGADINTADEYGQYVMHEVARVWQTEVAKFLLMHGADVNQRDDYGRTPLHVASAVNYPEMVSFLIENGADIDSKTYGDEQTPVHYAAKNDAVDSLKILLNCGANIENKDYKQRTPLQLAAEFDRPTSAKLLIEKGADAGVHDSSMMAAIVLLIQKMPNNALLALDQFCSMDRKTRKKQFYLNRLSPLIEDKSCFAKSPLEAIVETQRYELLLHPVMKALIKIKWKKFAKCNALISVVVNLTLAIFWTTLMCTRPTDKDKMYADSRMYWGSILEGIAATTLNIYVVLEVLDFFKSLRKLNCYKKWREKEIRKDLKFCHDYWPEERIYLKREIRELKCHRPSYVKDYWNIFDWITYSLMG